MDLHIDIAPGMRTSHLSGAWLIPGRLLRQQAGRSSGAYAWAQVFETYGKLIRKGRFSTGLTPLCLLAKSLLPLALQHDCPVLDLDTLELLNRCRVFGGELLLESGKELMIQQRQELRRNCPSPGFKGVDRDLNSPILD